MGWAEISRICHPAPHAPACCCLPLMHPLACLLLSCTRLSTGMKAERGSVQGNGSNMQRAHGVAALHLFPATT